MALGKAVISFLRAAGTRRALGGAVVLATTIVGWCLAVPAWADTVTVTVQLSPTTITANGTDTTSATATVTDQGVGLPLQDMTFSSTDSGNQFGPVSDNGDGTYTVTVTSSTTAGTPTITATDNTAGQTGSGSATLTQTAGPPEVVNVALQPGSIPANGSSQSTATATVTDQYGNAVTGDPVTFASSDSGESITANGPDSAVIQSSMAVGQATITGTDANGLQAQAVLTQVANPTTTSFATSPSSLVSNQAATLTATISASGGQLAGTVTFANAGLPIAGCTSESVSAASPTARCVTAFGAVPSLKQLTATFTPAGGSDVSASSAAASSNVGKDATSVAIGLASPTVKAGGSETYVAFVIPTYKGSLSPSGSVSFLDGGQPIAQCQQQPVLASSGEGLASCTVSYATGGSHDISAAYSGDGNFASSSALGLPVPVRFLGTLGAKLHWSFVSTAAYTKVLMLEVKGASPGSTVLILCHGAGCPFARSAAAVTKTVRCGSKGKRKCATNGTVNLTSRLASRRLRPGAKLTVDIVRPGWIGRSYTFIVKVRSAPQTASACVTSASSGATAC